VIYAVVGVAAPLPMLWAVHGLSAIQRDRVRAMLGIGIRPPAERHGRWSIAPWRSAGTWRQLGYHLVAVGVDGVGGGLVLACWMAPILAVVFVVRHRLPTGDLGFLLPVAVALVVAAPWLARSHARISAGLARTLLGASRNDELALQVESLARSRADIVAATDAERRRIERDLHDGAQQRLVSLAMNLGIARANLVDLPELARLAIADAHDEAILVLSEMRAFIRGLHPAVLNDRGLDAALSGLVAHAPVPVRLTVDGVAAGGTALDPEVVAQLMVRHRTDPMERLTPRELDVLRLMAEGRSNSGIVKVLRVSPSAVEKYVTNIFVKLDLPPAHVDHRRVLAVLKYLGV